MQDLVRSRLLEVRGLLAFHDFDKRRCPGVFGAASYFMRNWPNYKVEGDSSSMLILRKKFLSSRLEMRKIDRLVARAVGKSLQWQLHAVR